MNSQLVTFFEELQILLEMVNKAFPAGDPTNSNNNLKNVIFLNERGNVVIVVWGLDEKQYFTELDQAEDETMSFEDVVGALKSYVDKVTNKAN